MGGWLNKVSGSGGVLIGWRFVGRLAWSSRLVACLGLVGGWSDQDYRVRGVVIKVNGLIDWFCRMKINVSDFTN